MNSNNFIVLVILGVVGITAYENRTLIENKVKTVSIVRGTPLENEVHQLISGLPLEKKENFYKALKGMADFAKNAKRIRRVHKVSELTGEVFSTYKLENNPELDLLISKKMKENNLNQDVSLADSWERVSTIYGEIAEGIRYSIEQTKEKK